MSDSASTGTATELRSRTTVKSYINQWFGERSFAWVLMMPTILLLFLVAIFPVLFVLVISFTQHMPGQPLLSVDFVGLHNYIRAFYESRFWHGIYITCWFVFVSVGIQAVLGYFIATALLRVHPLFRRIALTFLLVPMMLAPTVVGILWKMMFKARYGVLNYLLETLIGISGPAWLSNQTAALSGLLIADIWEWTPFAAVLLLAGMQSLSQDVYDAAYVDGSTPWQVFKNVTFPLMKPFLFLAIFLRMIFAWKMFDLIYAITKGGPGEYTESIAWYTYQMGFTYFDQGYAAALSIIQLLVIVFIGKALLTQLTKVTEEARS